MTTSTTRTSTSGNDSPVDNEPRPPMWKVWLLASRPHTLTASISPVLVGHHATVTYFGETPSSTGQWLVFCMCIQLGTNLHNDYADYIRGADTHERVGQARATQKGWLTPPQTLAGSYLCLSLALAIGLSLSEENDPILWFIILSSIFNAFAYTGGQQPLGYIGLGEVSLAYSGLADIFCFLYFGFVATLTIPYLHVRDSNLSLMDTLQKLKPCIYMACPVGFLATAIIVVNNTRDRYTDVLAHKRTLAVRFGGTFCRAEYMVLILSSYVMITFESYFVRASLWHLVPLLSLPLAIPQLQDMRLKEGSDLNPHVGGTARLQLVFCALLSLGLRLGATDQ